MISSTSRGTTRIDLVIFVAADHRRTADSARCCANCAFCRSTFASPRTPTGCAFGLAPIPMSAHFRCSTFFDKPHRRLGCRHQARVRQDRRFARADRAIARACCSPRSRSNSSSRGPVLFKQKRYGFNNELIEVYKFRSMYADQLDAISLHARHARRSARDPRRPLHPQNIDRRTAATLQRRLQRRPVARRPAPACRAREGG